MHPVGVHLLSHFSTSRPFFYSALAFSDFVAAELSECTCFIIQWLEARHKKCPTNSNDITASILKKGTVKSPYHDDLGMKKQDRFPGS